MERHGFFNDRLPGILLALAAAGAALLRILGLGYMPPDDVMRHSAFAVTNRAWDGILVGRAEALFDQSPGWHALLRLVHGLTGADAGALAVLSIVLGFLLVVGAGLAWVRRPEAWVATLAAFFALDGALAQRVTLGRPLLVSASLAILLLGSLRTPGLRPWLSLRSLGWMAAGALATWIHGSWYLFLLIPGCLVLAGRWREAARLAPLFLAGCVLGALLTGHPWRFLGGEVAHVLSALGKGEPSVVMELQPGRGGQSLALALGAALVAWRGGADRRDAVLILGGAAWILGFLWIWRFYLDWAFPALALSVAWRLEGFLERLRPPRWGRPVLALLAAAALVAAVGWNRRGRWSVDGALYGLPPSRRDLLPEPGGVLYADSMFVFYATFHLNPQGPWRYAPGYEPALMEPADRGLYFEAQRQGPRALAPWAERMTPRDRMVILGPPQAPPPLPRLQWVYLPPFKWVGRVPVP